MKRYKKKRSLGYFAKGAFAVSKKDLSPAKLRQLQGLLKNRRKRRLSEREVMRIKRKLKKSARKLRLGAKRTGAYVYGTLRRIVGNPTTKARPIPGKFYRVYWSHPSRGETAPLIFKGEQLLKLSISQLSGYWPLKEGLKMAKVHFRGPYDSWDDAFMDS